MKSYHAIISVILCVVLSPSHAAPVKSRGVTISPVELSCTIDSSNTYSVSWNEVEPSKKYLVDLNCESDMGNLKIKPSQKTANCEDGSCTSTITQQDFASAIEQAISDGDIEVMEGEFSLTFTCSANVRALPSTRNVRHQGTSICEDEVKDSIPDQLPGEEETIKRDQLY